MKNTLVIARQQLLEPLGLTEQDLNRVLEKMLKNQLDYAELYFQLSKTESWSLEDQIIKEGNYSVNKGVGIRAVHGEKSGYAFSDELNLSSLLNAADAAKNIATVGGSWQQPHWKSPAIIPRYEALDPFTTLKDQDKIELLQMLDTHARRESKITQVNIGLHAEYEIVLIVANDGTFAADVRPLVRLNIGVIAESNGRRESGYAGGGGRFGYEYFTSQGHGLRYCEKAVREALVALEARPAPAGTFPVVLGAGWPGVLLHEAIGHGLEGDFNRKGSSVFAGRLGEQVASPLCTVVDDGSLSNRRGSVAIDDEGTPGQCTVLIEKGILKGYMFDKMNARLMGKESTGNGRRESYAHMPIPRMTNTYLLPGEHDPEEIIRSVDRGIYAVNFSGGQVDITSGKFVFSMSEAYMIENGKVTYPIKGATLIGNGPDVLTRVTMVGNDLALDDGVGVCGKDGQSVPVGVGQPTLRIDGLTVGGTQ
jgi:TldD protein